VNEIALYNLTFALPICAVCNKPVDKMESMYLPDYDGKLFRAHCHGMVEDYILGSYTMLDATEITFGKAFTAPQLTGAKLQENNNG
jgi:hypothetical protein